MGFLLQSARLRDAGFPHGFTLRTASDGTPLDYAFSRENSKTSEALLASELGIDATRLYQVTQVHGTAVVNADGPAKAVREVSADALILQSRPLGAPNSAVGVRVADCVPILIADLGTAAVAAVHAGWRGVVGKIALAALKQMGPGRKLAAIGPCIGVCCFEVSREVGEEIAAATDRCVMHLLADKPSKAQVDLRAAVRMQLRAAGLLDEDIDDVGGCTRCEGTLYHSYRREGEASGRMLGVIASRR